MDTRHYKELTYSPLNNKSHQLFTAIYLTSFLFFRCNKTFIPQIHSLNEALSLTFIQKIYKHVKTGKRLQASLDQVHKNTVSVYSALLLNLVVMCLRQCTMI